MAISLQGVKACPGWSVLGLLALALLGLLAAPGCTSSAPDIMRQPGPPAPGKLSPAAEVGRLAPDFTLTDLEGNAVTLSDFRDKTVLINFWATWCPPCRAEMPEIEAVYQQYRSQDVAIIGIDLDETESEVRQFVEEGGYSWTFVIDTTGEVSRKYGITGIPTSFFIDREGVIRVVTIGAMTRREIETKLAEAMR